MFSQACVKNPVHGGRGMRGRGVHGMCGRAGGHVWQGGCMAGGAWQGGACVAGGHAWQDSSRMCTICSSGCWGGGGHVSQHALGRGEGYVSQHALGRGCLPRGMSVQGGVCPSACWDTPPSPVNRMTDRRLWKYYLATTTLRTVNIHKPSSSLLLPTNEVWGKVMFLHLSVILFTGGSLCPGGISVRETPIGYRAGSTHPTGMHSCLYLQT